MSFGGVQCTRLETRPIEGWAQAVELLRGHHGADLRGVAFFKQDLSGVDLTDAQVQTARFTQCALRGAKAPRVDFRGCVLDDATFEAAWDAGRSLTLEQAIEEALNE